MYRVAIFLLRQPDWWGDVRNMADALAVLLLTWNANFYRYGGGALDGHRLERCLRLHWKSIEQFHPRNILSFTNQDNTPVHTLFNALLDALGIKTSSTRKVRKSPVGVAKALHLLAPDFFPIWDYAIARAYGCAYSSNPAGAYVRFCALIRDIAAHLEPEVQLDPDRSLVKRIDEYNYARFSKRWI